MALQRELRRVFAFAAALCLAAMAMGMPVALAGGTGAYLRADLFDEIHERAAPIERTLQSVSARFVETSTSTLLRAPQVATGTLVARRPRQLRLEYTGTDPRTVLVDGDRMSLSWPGRHLNEARDIGGMMRRAGRFLEAGSPVELRKHFDIEAVVASDRPGTWRVTFIPKRARMRDGLSRVLLWIDQTSLVLRALKMEYPGGDTRLLEFADVRLNPPVPADAFALIVVQ